MSKISSPCRGQCQLVGGICLGCGRTGQEISHWSVMSEPARQQVMAALAGRLSTHACPACGEPSFCAVAAGTPQPCWCMDLPADPSATEPDAAALCLCRHCLAQRRS